MGRIFSNADYEVLVRDVVQDAFYADNSYRDKISKERQYSDIERLREYGQKDHYRLYGRDLVSRVSNYGFQVKSFRPDETLKETEIEKFRFLRNDYLFIGEKLL